MGTKVKGLLKGLRYISQIFDEPDKKEDEFQIGGPTDVKHVAHIGIDNGPGAVPAPAADSPSWMKGYESTQGGHQSGQAQAQARAPARASTPTRAPTPTQAPARALTSPSVEDSSKRIVDKAAKSDGESDPIKKEKSRTSRRRESKGSSGSLKLKEDENVVSDSPARDVPDIPKKTRRKKSKDSSSSRPSKHRSLNSCSDPQSSLKSHSAKENECGQAA